MSPQNSSRFRFVNDVTLRNNLDHTMDHIALLSAFAERFPDDVKSSFYKTVIMHTAAIVEAVLHHCLFHKIKDPCLNKKEWVFGDFQKISQRLIQHSADEEIVIAKRFKGTIKVGKRADFSEINCACLEYKLLTKNLSEKVDRIRVLRNRIHLQSLENLDQEYTKPQINNIFKDVREILDHVEIVLK